MTALDADVSFVAPALLAPRSTLRTMFAKDSANLDGLTQIVEIDSNTWEGSAGIDVLTTQSILAYAINGDMNLANAPMFTILAKDSDVRDVIRRLITVSNEGLTSGPGQEPGPDESEQLQAP